MRSFLIKLFSQSSKSITFCEDSASFQGSHQMLRLPRLLTLCHVCAALTLRFMVKTTLDTSQNAAPATQMQNAALQSAAPATRKRRACIDTLPKYCACHAKRENDLPSCDFEAPKRAFRARLPSNFTCRGNLPKHLRKLSRMAVNNDATTTRRPTRREHRSNPRPQL